LYGQTINIGLGFISGIRYNKSNITKEWELL